MCYYFADGQLVSRRSCLPRSALYIVAPAAVVPTPPPWPHLPVVLGAVGGFLFLILLIVLINCFVQKNKGEQYYGMFGSWLTLTKPCCVLEVFPTSSSRINNSTIPLICGSVSGILFFIALIALIMCYVKKTGGEQYYGTVVIANSRRVRLLSVVRYLKCHACAVRTDVITTLYILRRLFLCKQWETKLSLSSLSPSAWILIFSTLSSMLYCRTPSIGWVGWQCMLELYQWVRLYPSVNTH